MSSFSPSIQPTLLPTLSISNYSLSPSSSDSSESAILKNEAYTVASLSIFFYGVIFSIAVYYYRKFQKLDEIENPLLQPNRGRYDQAKRLFFGILAVSSFLEIPSYIGCLANDGPTDCEWKSVDQLIFWFFHMISLCGYACCIIIPCVLWSDMINKKDGKLFFSSYPYSYLKRYFQLLIILYFLNTFVDILVCSAYWRNSDRMYYREAPTYTFCALSECVLIVLISTGCLYCGITLDIYVHEAKLNPTTEMKFLFTLNLILSIIVLSFLGRAILILRFAPGISESFQNSVSVNYPTYMIISRWIPDVFCQILLIYIMRLSSSDVSSKYQLRRTPFHTKENPSTDPQSQDYIHSDEYLFDSIGTTSRLEETILPALAKIQHLNQQETTPHRSTRKESTSTDSFRREPFNSTMLELSQDIGKEFSYASPTISDDSARTHDRRFLSSNASDDYTDVNA